MRLGVSAWRLNGARFGVARYTEYLIANWSNQIGDNDSLTLFLYAPLENKIQAQGVAIEEKVIRAKLTNALWENLLLPFQSSKVDVLFGPSYSLPLLYKGKRVVCIHSANEAEPGNHSFLYKLTYSLKYRLAAKVADHVIVNSQSTKDRVVAYYNIPPEKVSIVWLGVDNTFAPYKGDDKIERNQKTRLQYLGKDVPYVIFVGTMSARRNVPLLMKAFAAVKKAHNLPHHLLLVGKNSENIPLDQLAEELGITDSYAHVGGAFANHKDIVPIYDAAAVYILPSESEGFSLTLAEAMACGVPVITSNKSSLGEVANGYALTLDKMTVESISDALIQTLTSAEFRANLREKGLERAKALRWEECARKTLKILREVADF